MKKLEVNNEDSRTTPSRKYWWYECECGKIVSRRSDSKSQHCSEPDCTKAMFNRHGKSESRLYSIWSGMRDRCINGNHKSAIHYKEKGITICDAWSLFVNFERWALEHGYEDHLTIDRIDINGDYEPGNCEWVPREENTIRQSLDYHGNHKAITALSVVSKGTIEFKSITDTAKYIINNKLSKTENVKNVSTVIGMVLNPNNRRKNAYGFTFSYKEAKK